MTVVLLDSTSGEYRAGTQASIAAVRCEGSKSVISLEWHCGIIINKNAKCLIIILNGMGIKCEHKKRLYINMIIAVIKA